MTQSTSGNVLIQPPHVPPDFAEGIFLVDKPATWTSFDVVAKMRSLLRIKKIGHAGTLDPMATGLLIVCIGRGATKRIPQFMEMEKVYEGTLRLGETTPSYDADTPVSSTRPWESVTSQLLEKSIAGFVGNILQTPPMYSAIKQGGERLYKKARRGETVPREPREVTVFDWQISDRRESDVDFVVRCSKGTYIRSLAHDLGEKLGCGAHLVALRRTRIGSFDVKSAWTMEMLREAIQKKWIQPQTEEES